MQVNVSQLLKEPSGASRDYEIDERLAAIEGAGPRRVVGAVKLIRTDKGVWASAELDTAAPCTCGRCLTEYLQTIHISIEEETFPLGKARPGAGLPDDRGESLYINEDRVLELTEAIRQYAALNLPMKPICRPDCNGICPVCGSNLNELTCDCDRVARVGRWDELLELVRTSDSPEEPST